jgi:nuclear pore complex protein Nup155
MQPAQAQPQMPQTPMPKLPPAASKSQNQTVSTEERGARTINSALLSEARYPDLDSYLSRKIILG